MNDKEPNTGRKLTLGEWAQVGELVGMFAVLLSLLAVAYGIHQNTLALRGGNGNLLYEMHSDLQANFLQDPSLAAIVVKLEAGDRALDPVEEVRWTKYRYSLLDLWAMAFQRNREGLMTDEEWLAWDRYFVNAFSQGTERLEREEWDAWGYGWDARFWRHVGDALDYADG